jgi:hypothetical protein
LASASTSSSPSERHPATVPSAATYARSIASAGGGHAIIVDAIWPSSSESPSTVYGPVYRLQPVEPLTVPPSKVALGRTIATSCGNGMPEASTHG